MKTCLGVYFFPGHSVVIFSEFVDLQYSRCYRAEHSVKIMQTYKATDNLVINCDNIFPSHSIIKFI